MSKMDLYEYSNLQKLPADFQLYDFKTFLNNVWQKYKDEKPKFWRESENDDNSDIDICRTQQFLFFEEDKIKSKNYVGYIKYGNTEFNLYPKFCRGKNKDYISKMLILWLSYSNNTIFPKIENSSLNDIKCDSFFECLIYLFAKYTSELLSVSIYQHYEEISEETNFLKGRLNFSDYIKNIVNGKAHKFYCTYDSFEINNKFNQIVKYVSKCLFEISKNDDSKNLLSDIIFNLDAVDDVICTYNDCNSVYINRFMEDFNIVLDYCKLFLQNSITFNESGDFNNFAFLLRTETLFEDFISNATKEILEGFKVVKTQVSFPLDNDKKYYIRPDILIYTKENSNNLTKIADVKYKEIKSRQDISYSDIYQCMAYAKKLKCNDVTLIYPKSLNYDFQNNNESIEIEDINIKLRFIDCCSQEDFIKIKDLFDFEKDGITSFQCTN